MADFVAVLKKTIDGLVDPTPQMRERVYEKARATVGAKLAAINPPPPAAAVERQRRSLEDAIRQVEAEYAQAPAAPARPADPIDELENVFASLNASRTADASPRPAPPPPADTARHTPAAAPAMRPQPAQPAAPRPQPSPAPIPAPSAQPEPAEFEPSPAMQQDDYQDHGYAEEDQRLPRRRGYGGLIAAVVILALLAGGGYAAWLKRDELQAMLPLKGLTTAAKAPAANTPAKSASATAPAANPAEQQAAAPTPAAPQAGTAENSAPSATAPAEPETPAAARSSPSGSKPMAARSTMAPRPLPLCRRRHFGSGRDAAERHGAGPVCRHRDAAGCGAASSRGPGCPLSPSTQRRRRQTPRPPTGRQPTRRRRQPTRRRRQPAGRRADRDPASRHPVAGNTGHGRQRPTVDPRLHPALPLSRLPEAERRGACSRGPRAQRGVPHSPGHAEAIRHEGRQRQRDRPRLLRRLRHTALCAGCDPP